MEKSIIDQVVDEADEDHKKGQKARDEARRQAEEARRKAEAAKKAAKEKAKKDKVDKKHELKMAKALSKGKPLPAKPGKAAAKAKPSKPKVFPPPGKDSAFDVKATAFISNVYTKLEGHRPGYSPLGMVLEDKKWVTNLAKNGFAANGTIEAGMFKEPLVVGAEYVSIRDIQKGDFLMSHANTATSKKQYIAKCFVVAHVDEDMLSGLRAFTHPNFSPYFYDIDRDRLIFNSKDTKTDIFSNWFKKDGKPKTVVQLIREVVDKNGVFTKKRVGAKLNLQGEELDKLFKTLIEKHIIVDVDKKNYAFV